MIKVIFIFLIMVVLYQVKIPAQTIIAPDHLTAESEDSSYIKVRWHDNSANEQGFYIERTEINAPIYWEIIGEVPQNTVSYFDYWATRGIKYYYRVFAYLDTIRSGYSNIDSTVLLGDTSLIPATPSDLTVQKITATSITIHWQDNSGNENGFIIARKAQGDLYYHYVDSVGTDVLTYQEVGLTPDNVYQYKVCSYNNSGISDYTNTVEARTQNTLILNVISEQPENYFLGNNYPNPFNPVTNIKFGISKYSFVKLTVYNSLGMETESILNQNLSPGTYQVKWNAQNYPSGTYFYKIETNEFTEVKKMILVK